MELDFFMECSLLGYYSLNNYLHNFYKQKLLYNLIKITLSVLFAFHILNFLTITPYHYTFLNYFSGNKELRYKKFENDYWSTSLKELIMSSKLGDGRITYYSCGLILK